MSPVVEGVILLLATGGSAALAYPIIARGLIFFQAKGLIRSNYRHEMLPAPMGLVPLAAVLPVYAILLPLLPVRRTDLLVLMLLLLLTGSAGFLDDLTGEGEPKGLRAHFAAWRQGRWTAGAVKAAVGLLAGIIVAGTVDRGPEIRPWAWADVLVDIGLVALAANALNALDLRPGRAVKVFLAAAALLILMAIFPLLAGAAPQPTGPGIGVLLAPLTAALAVYLPVDLARRGMLGDAGANPLGAALGLVLARQMSLPGGILTLALLAAFHLLTERVSLTRLIASRPWLDRLDQWGQNRRRA